MAANHPENLDQLYSNAVIELNNGNYSEAASKFQHIVSIAGEHSHKLHFLFMGVFSRLMDSKADISSVPLAEKICLQMASQSPKSQEDRLFVLSMELVRAFQNRNPLLLRGAVERFSQRQKSYTESEFPQLMTMLDQTLLSLPETVDQSSFDFTETSYSLWQRGLHEMAEGNLQSASEDLMDSISRYQLGSMEADVLWSWFDAILCHILNSNLSRAQQLFKEREEEARAAKSQFLNLAELAIKAFKEPSLDAIAQLTAGLKNKKTGTFLEPPYSRIIRRLTSLVRDRINEKRKVELTTQSNPGRNGDVGISAVNLGSFDGNRIASDTSKYSPSSIAPGSTQNSRTRAVSYDCLISRPARLEPAEIQDLVECARTVNLGNTRPELVRHHIDTSLKTLREERPFEQGCIYLVTDLYPRDGKQRRFAGACKIQAMVDACWRQKRRSRNGGRGRLTSEYGILIFDHEASNGIEIAGNVVPPEFRSQGIGTFHLQSRLLFLLLHGDEIGGAPRSGGRLHGAPPKAVANLLTEATIPPTLRMGDFKSFPAFAGDLCREDSAVAESLFSQLSEDTKEALRVCGADRDRSELAVTALLKLNEDLREVRFPEKLFESVKLSYETIEMLNRRTEPGVRSMLKRLILEDEFRTQLLKKREYPFYERFVRTLLNGIDYDAADELRYKDQPILVEVLGELRSEGRSAAMEAPVIVPMHALPEEVLSVFGTVRAETTPAMRALERYNFRPTTRHDFLDGGPYFELELSRIAQNTDARKLTVEFGQPNSGAGYHTFSPLGRSKADFIAVKCQSNISDGVLTAPKHILKEADLRPGDNVMTIIKR